MKKLIVLITAIVLLLTSCGINIGDKVNDIGEQAFDVFQNSRTKLLDALTDRDHKAFQEMLDATFAALDKGDKEGLKELFADSVIKESPDLDNQIEAFFQVVNGPVEIEYIHLLLASSESVEYGKRCTELSGGGKSIIVVAGGIRYYIYMEMCSRDDFNKDNEGIHTLEFATEDAYNSEFFVYHAEGDDGAGLYYQDSAERREDIRWIEGRPWKYTYYDRKLTAGELREAVENNSDFDSFKTYVGEPNCSWMVYKYYYYELDNGLFAVCKLDYSIHPVSPSGYVMDSNNIVAIYIADEEKNLETVWMADDIDKVHGGYHYFLPADRELTEDYFKSFALRSNKMSQLQEEIGSPNVSDTWYCYYKISDNLYVGCHYRGDLDYTGDNLEELFVVDSENKLYSLWQKTEND